MSMPPTELSVEQLVHSSHQRLVAVEVDDHGVATLFVRTESDEIVLETLPFEPWLLTGSRELGEFLPASRGVALAGEGFFRHRWHFASPAQCAEAIRALKNQTGVAPTAGNAPYRIFSDQQQQLLTSLPARLFRTMQFQEIKRLQIDIETLTSPGFDFPNPEREGDRIVLVALRDSTGWECCLGADDGDERALLEQLVAGVAQRDPDVIEGHNLFAFDLPYIETRAARHGVELRLGRGGRLLQSRPSRFTSGERTSSYRRYTAWGRHIVDTLHLVQLYDVSHRDLESYSLKAVARHFGVAAQGRTYVAGGDIADVYHEDRRRLVDYALDDVRETDAISRILSPSYFYQAQIVPFSYQSCVTRGNAARIDAMLVADYMLADAALPRPGAQKSFAGGLTESFASGVFENVWHIDVQSLYPSIVVARGVSPRSDTLGRFNTQLGRLRQFRLVAKKRMQEASSRDEKEFYDALQSSFKILINSFYGYLGFSGGTFNDYSQAEAVTAEGRRILSSMVDFLEDSQATVIEIDTDGIYFVPPGGVDDAPAFTAQVQNVLPTGIDVELDARFRAMFSYKAKNYALLAEDGTVSITGAALKSRGLEPFQRRFIHQSVDLLLRRRASELHALKRKLTKAIADHDLPLADFAKRETLSTPPRVYREKREKGQTRRSAAYELVLQARRDYKQGDQVAFYVTGDKKNVAVADAGRLLSDNDSGTRDENVPYYLDKLDKLYAKFLPFIPTPPDACDLPLFAS